MSQSKLSTLVLIVADNPAAREELESALALVTSADTVETASLAQAVAELQMPDQEIDLAVIDLEMAGSGAVTLTRKIREPQTLGPQNIAILLVGGATGSTHYQTAVRLGIQGHFPRPFTPDQLRAALRAALIARPTTAPAVYAMPAPVRREVKTITPQPAATLPYEEQSGTIPFANKPFRHGLQSRMRAAPLTSDEAFGFEPMPASLRPRPMREPESPPVIMGQLRVAVA